MDATIYNEWPVIKTPARIMILGCSQSGKTSLILKILQNQKHAFGITFDKVVLAHSAEDHKYQDMADAVPELKIREGLPEEFMRSPEKFVDGASNTLLILDDMMDEVVNSAAASKLFYVGSGKNSISIIVCAQNLYPKGKYAKTIALQCTVKILTANPADKGQVARFASQIEPGQTEFIKDAYAKALNLKPYNYLVCDMHPTTPPKLRYYTGLLPHEPRVYFLPKNQ